MSITPSLAAVTVRLGACMVVVTSQGGAAIPPTGSRGWRRLTPAELLLLQTLAGSEGAVADHVRRVALSANATQDDLEEFVGDLEARGALASGAAMGELRHAAPQAPVAARDAAVDEVEALVASTPIVLGPAPGGFEIVDHDGRLIERLSAAELDLLGRFGAPSSIADASLAHRRAAGPLALGETAIARLVARLCGCGLLKAASADAGSRRQVRDEEQYRQWMRTKRAFLQVAERQRVRHEEERAAIGADRVPVQPIEPQVGVPPLALGMLLSYARVHDGGVLTEHYDLFPDWSAAERGPGEVTRQPAVFLFSNYVWSHGKNLSLSREIKQLSPESVTIFGGPDTPKYQEDVEGFFRANPHVDIAVRGEGEVTTAEILVALRGRVGKGLPDLSSLRDVPGLAFRDAGRIIRTPDRDRLADLDVVPSPYLTGVFDAYGEVGGAMAIIETNRGCPYRCAFCDWGSATLSKIRQFALERVFEELEWCAARGFSGIFVADANFGVFPRDVEIAGKVAELKARYGYPRSFHTNYAKNSVKHLRPIVELMSEAGILTEGLLSLQSMDAGTLAAIRRTNIKVERYDELAREFRSAGLPLFIDLMVGLPGSTMGSFMNDLQECVEREVNVKIHPTELLVNSPMNEPSYREEHGIEIASADDRSSLAFPTLVEGDSHRKLVVASTTFTKRDYREMLELRRVFRLTENFGILRLVSRYVRQEANLPEVRFYDMLRRAAADDPGRWPVLSLTWRTVPSFMVPPVSWSRFLAEVRTYLVDVLDLAADDALDTALAVQHAVLPAPGRALPRTLELPHDFTAWHQRMLAVKGTDERGSWPSLVPPLRSYGPGTFVVEDPHGVCAYGLGFESETDAYADWELVSPVSRAMPGRHRVLAEESC